MKSLKFVRFFSLTISLIVLISIFAPTITISSDIKYRNKSMGFDFKIKLLMWLNHIPSLVICIIKENKVVFMDSYGFSNYYLRNKARTDNIYLAESISKTVTSTALMQMYEKGLFDLDDDISKYIPFEVKNPKFPEVNITFRMLLSHQSSLNDFGIRLGQIPSILGYAYSNNTFYPLLKMMLVPGEELYNEQYYSDYTPGKNARYCELGYAMVGYLVETISGLTLEKYCQENIFKPLNMTNTSFYPNSLNQKKLMKPYTLIVQKLIPLASKEDIAFNPIVQRLLPLPKYDFQFLDPPAGLWTNAEDLSHFLIAHMNGGVYNGYSILKESTVDIMHTLHYPNSTDSLLANFMAGNLKLQHGLGWFFIDLLGLKLEGHAGASPGYNCHMYVVNTTNGEKAGLILLANGPMLAPAAFSGIFAVFKYMKLLELILEKVD
jgi:CubicO group peptidase (beta-lactamase class C family)